MAISEGYKDHKAQFRQFIILELINFGAECENTDDLPSLVLETTNKIMVGLRSLYESYN